MKNIWFTSDPHFGHKNIIKYCNRPYTDIEEMNEALIKNWNELVKQNDEIWILGDFMMGKQRNVLAITDRLNGTKRLIKGNHDPDDVVKNKSAFFDVHDYFELRVGGEFIVMSHYPFQAWNKSHHGSWHLHGHCHGTVPAPEGMRRLDVGVDCHSYSPISFEHVRAHMLNIKVPRLER